MRVYFIVAILFFFFNANAQNASLVKDLTAGSASSFDYSGDDKIVGHIGDKLLFVIQDDDNISRLYVTEGTEASTVELQAGVSSNEYFINFLKVNANTIVYVVYDQSLVKYKLYTTNGSSPVLMTAHNENIAMANLHYFNGALYYNNYSQIRKIDLANTLDESVFAIDFSRFILDFHIEDTDQLYYASGAASSEERDTLIRHNLTTSTSDTLAPIGYAISRGLNFQKVNNKILLFNRDLNGLAYLYATDGTAAGTSLVKTFAWQGNGICNLQVVKGNKLYFDAALDPDDPDAGNFELFVTDGTSSGTYSLSSSANPFRDPKTLVVYNNAVYFQALPTNSFYPKLYYTTDGENVVDAQTPYYYFSEGLIVLGNAYYVTGFYNEPGDDYGLEIWKRNDIDLPLPMVPSHLFYETRTGSDTYYDHGLYATETKIFFIGDDDATGRELYLFSPSDALVTSSLESQTENHLLTCFPNPATDRLSVKYTGSDQIIGLYLRTTSGEIISHVADHTDIDLSLVNAGLYFLEVELKNSRQVLKVIRK